MDFLLLAFIEHEVFMSKLETVTPEDFLTIISVLRKVIMAGKFLTMRQTHAAKYQYLDAQGILDELAGKYNWLEIDSDKKEWLGK